MILQSAISGFVTLVFLGLAASNILPWIFGTFAFIAGIITVNTLLGKPIPFLRLSFLRLALSMKTLTKEWQVGDGREEAAVQYVIKNAPQGDVLAAIKAIDNYAYQHKFLINVGDEKGELLDNAIKRVQPKIVLELGAYVGYSALRIARLLPKDGHLYSVEFNPENAKIARRMIEHAGVSAQVTFIDGYLGDGGKTLAKLKKLIPAGSLDMVFIDHDKEAYMADLKMIVESRWLKKGSVVVADNIGYPGAPVYKTYMDNEEGKLWNTTTHKTHVEYQSVIPDLVLESTFLG
jgi:catechol O-methyltransferase